MAYSWAKPGVRVVCVDDSPARENGVMYRRLAKDQVYKVRGAQMELWRNRLIVTVDIDGLSRVGRFKGFGAFRFRPAVDGSQFEEADRALFQGWLKNIPNRHEITALEAAIRS